jgi:Zn-dependent metalloprotease
VKNLPRISLILAVFLSALCIFPQTTYADDPIFSTGTPDELEKAKQISLDILRGRAASRAIGNVDDYRIERVEVDHVQVAHTRVRQTAGGVPVWGGEAIVHLWPDGRLFTITDDLYENIAVNTEPNLSKDDAILAAEEYYLPGAQFLTEKPEADMWIFRTADRDHLVYRVQLTRLDGSEFTSIPVMFIDAHTREKVFEYDNLQSATGSALYSGTVSIQTSRSGPTFYMEDLNRRMGTFDMNSTGNEGNQTGGIRSRFTDTDDNWNAAVQHAGVEAHYGAAQTFDFYKDVFGRNGIDGNFGPGAATAAADGSPLVVSQVHFGSSGRFNNAFWTGNLMLYGDGDGIEFSPLTTLDICGHEMTHGVIQHTAHLSTTEEGGALNESWADVFGAMVELYTRGGAPTADTWKIGEQAYTPGSPGDALRYLNDPRIGGDPDHYSKRRYPGLCIPVRANDQCGVHANTGISNKAFYLVANGGTHPLSGITVVGIGVPKARRIWYDALFYMNYNTKFMDARTATLDAVVANNAFSRDVLYTVERAWCAVGVGDCPAGLVINGGFEGTVAPWISSGTGFLYTRQGNYPLRGTGYITLGANNSVSGQVYQTISIPTTAVGKLSFWLNVTSSERNARDALDEMSVEIRDTTGHLLGRLANYSNRDNVLFPGFYFKRTFNIGFVRGQTVRIVFNWRTDSTRPTTFRIDDVALE